MSRSITLGRVLMVGFLLVLVLNVFFFRSESLTKFNGFWALISPDEVTCEGRVALLPISTPSQNSNLNSPKIFLLETSGRATLNPRQACAIESALRFTNLNVFVLIRSPFLNLSDVTTCHLFKLSKETNTTTTNLYFREIQPDRDLKDLPFDCSMFKKKLLQGHKFYATFLSDALRLAYLYNYGGWYGDLDFIYLRSLAKENGSILAATGGKSNASYFLTNAAMKMERRHPFLLEYMEDSVRAFRGQARAEMGPNTLTSSLKRYCNIPKSIQSLRNLSDPSLCSNIRVVPPQVFHPIRLHTMKFLWSKEELTPAFWNQTKRDAWAIHFFSYLTSSKEVTKNSRKEAYSYLAPIYCPNSFASVEEF
ncbi:alpha-1,4-N-acetylglucosaminyltransferase-like [Tigriopus californicus]|uniref:alpha-1,4-N-acetylglucosaminyltransferase-like n=1 Tax=Tigriopus californicus TaxID=6832 RepID=UPI0027DAAA4F|nr:alpha-1,4-N-acetylglucosaminyltransferase-like [Tigriopus californicus]